MIKGYVSSDEEDNIDYDNYDFGYSDPLVIEKPKPPVIPNIQNDQFKEKLNSAFEKSKLNKLFVNAAEAGDLAVLKELIALGAQVEDSDPEEWTPLMKACVKGNAEVVEFLLNHGSNSNASRKYFTPLLSCCTYTLVGEDLKLHCLRLLLEHGANVNVKDQHWTTALMYATMSGYSNIVTVLLEVPNIDVNLQDKEGWTALFYAVNVNNLELAKKLISAGTDLKLKDLYNRTVINLALDKGFTDMAKLLGYVEEKISEPVKTKMKYYVNYLAEIPDPDGQGGFVSEALNILAAFEQFNVKDISLPDLLNATDNDLYKIGVKLQPYRNKILCEGIHRFHLKPWKKSSMQNIDNKVPFSLRDMIAILGTLVRHMTLVNASLRYLDNRITVRENKEEVNLTVVKSMLIVLVNTYEAIEKLKISISNILEQADQIKPDISDDYIQHSKKKKKFGFFKYIILVPITGFLIYYTTHIISRKMSVNK